VVEMRLVGVRVELPTNNPIVLLREADGEHRVLPIFIGAVEATAIAFALTNVACPLACVRTTGLFGDTVSSDACVGKPSTFGSGREAHFSWCQPRPRIHSPGFFVFAASPTIATRGSRMRQGSCSSTSGASRAT